MPIQPPRFYGYFKARHRIYVVDGFGTVEIKPSIAWFNVPNSRVLVLHEVRTPEALAPGDILNEIVEYAIVTDTAEFLPPNIPSFNGQDTEGFNLPSTGIYLKLETIYPGNYYESRNYYPRQDIYSVVDLLSQPASEGPVAVFMEGVQAIESYLDNATWSGPGSDIVYTREASFAWAQRTDVGEFDPEEDGSWRPGAAGFYERFLLGTGVTQGVFEGWFLYAIERVLVLEFWRGGIQLVNRILDCSDLLDVIDNESENDLIHVIGVGYDFNIGQVSIGVSVKGLPGTGRGSEIAYKEWNIPELINFGYQHLYVHIGGGPVQYSDGSIYDRTAWAGVAPIQGMFTSEEYLTKGKLTSLMDLADQSKLVGEL